MELRQLRYFQAVAEQLGFSRAAYRLRIAQPALSRAVKELELELGVQLLSRTRRTVALTAAGRVFLHDTVLLLQRLDEAARRTQRTAAGEEGELRLGYIGPATQAFLGPIVKEFRRRFPRVTVVLEERTPERVWERVAHGSLAVGLTRPVLAHQALGLPSLLLRRERLCLALPSGHPLGLGAVVRWRQLAQEPLIVLSRREGVSLHDAVLAACRRAGFPPRLAHTPSLISTVLSYVEAGAGLGVISEGIASLGQSQSLVIRPLAPAACVDLVMVWSEKEDSPAALAFRQLIQEWRDAAKLWPLQSTSRTTATRL